MAASVTIEGLPELRKKFGELTDKQQRGVLRTALRAGGNVVVRSARQRVNVKTGNLRKGIKSKVSVKSAGKAEVDIGWDVKIAPHGHLVEMGHVLVKGKGQRARRIGHVPAKPFLRPALVESERQVIETIADNMRKHIEKVAAGR